MLAVSGIHRSVCGRGGVLAGQRRREDAEGIDDGSVDRDGGWRPGAEGEH